MDLRSENPFWLVRHGLINVYPKLETNLACDVLVVGGGITGALAAWHLQQAGLSTVVVDTREVVWGSTAASTALLQYEIDTPLTELTGKLGWQHASAAYLACRSSIGKLQRLTGQLHTDCGFALKPSLYLAKRKRSQSFFRQEYQARKRAGIDLEYWSASDLKKQMHLNKPAALWSEDGAQVDPFALTHALLASASKMGLRVYDRTTLASYTWKKNGLVARTSDGHCLRTGQVVFATGYESVTFIPRKLVDLHSTFALVSEPISGSAPLWKKECLIWEHANPYLYLRTTDDRRILLGGEDEPFHNPQRRDSALMKKTKTLERKVRHLFPQLKWQTAFSWAGTFGTTKDGLAYIGQIPEFPKAWFTLGFGGNGIVYSMLAAEIVRDGILGKKNPHARLFSFNR